MNNSEENIFAREKAIKYIGLSKKTEFEVRNKLKGLKVAPSIINEEIAYLKELDFINDIDYVKSYIKQNKKMLKYSIYEIRNKLLQKGIKTSIIDDEMEGLYVSEYESAVIQKLLSSKLKDYDDMKQKNYLYRRGFKL